MIRQIAVRSSTSFCKKVFAALLLKGTDVHRTTVRKLLVHDFNLKAFEPVKRSCLAPAMKPKRLAFAKQYEARWNKVFFSYESTIQPFAQRKWTISSPIGTRFNDGYTQVTVKHSPSVMTRGATSSNGAAGLFFLPIGITINGVRYRKMLEDKLKICMTIHECNVFVQDGAPYHRSKLVSYFLKKKNIKTLDWFGNSQISICLKNGL